MGWGWGGSVLMFQDQKVLGLNDFINKMQVGRNGGKGLKCIKNVLD